LLGVSRATSVWVKREHSRGREVLAPATYHSEVDRLTGLTDASEFFELLPDLSAHEQLSLVLFDVDDLRLLNERRGTVEADRLLAHLGSVIRERRGPDEIGARIGGDEFALCLLEDDTTEIVREVERIRQLFGEESGGATLSVGVCEAATLRRASVRLSLVEAAQDALGEAKRQRPAGLTIFRG
jgi:diguanylate cyclase (GGDEF)-like protein